MNLGRPKHQIRIRLFASLPFAIPTRLPTDKGPLYPLCQTSYESISIHSPTTPVSSLPMTPTTPAVPTSSYEKHTPKNDSIPSLMLKSMDSTQQRRSHSIPLPSSHIHRTESEVQLEAGLEAAERRNLRMFYRLVNGVRTRQQQQQSSLVAVQAESFESWASAPAERGYVMNFSRPRDCVPEGYTGSLCSLPGGEGHDNDVQDEEELGWRRSASAPPPCTDDDWSISGFSEQQPKEQDTFSDADECEDDGVFDIDL